MAVSKVMEQLVSLCCVLIAICQARNIVSKTKPEMKCAEIRPGMQSSFGFHCFTPVGDTNDKPSPAWTLNNITLHESNKYHMGMRRYESYFDGEVVEIYDMHLIISDVDQGDIGEYSMHVDMEGSHMDNTMMLPAALACGNHPLCYEDNCKWPEKLVCRSNPDAYCQMDMCEQDNLCWPRWFVGAKEVTCDDVEGISYFPQ